MKAWRKIGLQKMIDDINAEVSYTRSLTKVEALDDRVLDAIAQVPRDEFVPEAMKPMAFENRPLPIGNRQTISQPYIVALMTQLLALTPDQSVLEIGTGSGYQTAVLARLCRTVYSVEVFPAMAAAAADRLARLSFNNVHIRSGDGYDGWPEHAPYDAIIVTAAPDDIPSTLLEQLKPGGRLVTPVGLPGRAQNLVLVNKDERGEVRIRDVLGVSFVPLITTPHAPGS